MAAALPAALSEVGCAVTDPMLMSLRARLVDVVAEHCATVLRDRYQPGPR